MTRSGFIAVASAAVVAVFVAVGTRPPPHNDRSNANARSDVPLVRFEPTFVELGPRPWFSTVPFSANLRNDGTESLVISAVKTGCGCTVLDSDGLAGSSLPGGESVSIDGHLLVEERLGVHQKQVDVLFDDGSIRSFFLVFEGIAAYQWSPHELAILDINLDDEANDDPVRSVRFSSHGAAVRGIPTADVPWLRCGVHRLNGDEFEIVAQVVRRLVPHGKSFGRIRVHTDDENRSWFDVPVSVDAAADLIPTPGYVFLSVGESQAIRMFDRAGLSVPIDRIESTNPEAIAVRAFDDRLGATVLALCLTSDSAVIYATSTIGQRARFLVSVVDSKGAGHD